jgi:hypothetical protein
MSTYQAPQIDASPSFDAARGNEWGRNGWTKESYDRKNQEPVNFYDFTRKKLNFEIKRGEPLKDKDGNVRKDKKGHILYSMPSIIPLGSHPMTIKKRYDQRLEEIGHKPWKNANGNQPNTNVSIVLDGDHDRMTEIAFGKPVYFDKGTDNSLTQLLTVSKDELEPVAKKYGVEELVDTDQTYSVISIYALCFYKFLCDKFGEENVMGLACHLDETTPHFHALVIPVAEKQKSGRAGGYTLVDEDQNPVLDKNGDEIHITTRAYERMPENQRANYIKTKSTTIGLSYASYFGKTPGQTSRSYEKWHDMIHEEVTKQWGFDRGERLRDMTPQERADHYHKNKKQLERDRIAAEKRTKEQEEKEKEAKLRREEQEKKELEANARAKVANDRAKAAESKAEEQEAVVDANAITIGKQEAAISNNATTLKQQNSSLASAKRQEQEVNEAAATAKAEAEEAQNRKTTLDKDIESATAKLATANSELEKWGAMVFDEKSIMYPSLTEMITADGRTFREILEEKVSALVEILNKPIGIFQKHDNWKAERNKEAKAIVSELEDALFGPNGVDTAHKKAILQLGKDLYSDAKSKISNIYKENERLKTENRELKSQNQTLQNNYDTVKRNNAKLTNDLEEEKTANTLLGQKLENSKYAVDDNGNYYKWSNGPRNGQRVTHQERQKYLQRLFEETKKELEKEKADRLKEQAEIKRQREKEKQEMANECQAHKRHIREIKDFLIAAFSLDMKKMIQVIIRHWKAELKEFARDAMNEIKDILFREEPKIDGRKAYVSDAFAWAKVFASLDEDENWKRDESKLEPLQADAIRIVDGTWESYHSNHKLKDAAVEAVASLANTPNLKYCDEDDIEAVNDYLDSVPIGERNSAIAELRERASNNYNIKMESWLDNVIERIESNTLGGQGLTR